MTRILLLIISVLFIVETLAKDCAIPGQKYNITLTYAIQERAVVWKVNGVDIRDARIDIVTGSTCLPPLFAPSDDYVFHCMNNGTSYTIETENPENYKNGVFDTDRPSIEDNITISVIEPAIISFGPEKIVLNDTPLKVSCSISCTAPSPTITWKYRKQKMTKPEQLNDEIVKYEDCGNGTKSGRSVISISNTTPLLKENFTIVCELSYSDCDGTNNVFTKESSLIVIEQTGSSTPDPSTSSSDSTTVSSTSITTPSSSFNTTTPTVSSPPEKHDPDIVLIIIICVVVVVAIFVIFIIFCIQRRRIKHKK